MEWNSLFDKSEWLFRQILNREEKVPHYDSRLKDIAQKLSDSQYLHKKIEEQERFDYLKAYHKNIVPPKKIIIPSYLKVACILLLLIGSGTLLYIWQKQYPPQYYNETYFADIHPGKQQALLITHDGRKVKLNRDSGQIIRQNETIIQIDTTGLHYNPSSQVPTGIIYNTLVVPRGGEFFLTLSDGTKVWLNSDSRLEYPVNFVDSVREVTISGEAYFEVNHTNTPFIVKTNKGNIRVLGTEFNVNNYPESRETVTTLINGKIAYCLPDGQQLILTPNQQIIIRTNGQTEIRTIDTQYATSWKNGMFLFQEMRLEDIMNQLERWYDIHVFYTHERAKNLHFSGDLSRFKNRNTFIEMFEKSSDVKIEVQGKNLIIGM